MCFSGGSACFGCGGQCYGFYCIFGQDPLGRRVSIGLACRPVTKDDFFTLACGGGVGKNLMVDVFKVMSWLTGGYV